VAWFACSQLERKAVLLSHIAELQFLREHRDLFSRLAENMEQLKIEAGAVVDDHYFGKDEKAIRFIVVEEGLLAKQRVVDFTGHQNDESLATGISITVPKGKHAVRFRTYRSKTMFPDPALKDFVPYPFALVVTEPVIAYHLKLKDLESMLLTAQLQKIREAFRAEPNDDQVVKLWIQEHQAIQWQTFKQKCVREARQQVKVERAVMNGNWGLRLPAPPKAIKEHEPYGHLSRRLYA
jgi:hypothetical protein